MGGRSTTSRRGYDGNRDQPEERDPNKSRPTLDPAAAKNIALPTAAYSVVRGQESGSGMASRPAPSKIGTPMRVSLNTYNANVPLSGRTKEGKDVTVYQFEVSDTVCILS